MVTGALHQLGYRNVGLLENWTFGQMLDEDMGLLENGLVGKFARLKLIWRENWDSRKILSFKFLKFKISSLNLTFA